MKLNEITLRILVRKDFGACFDFYTQKLGLVPAWGDRSGPYTSFAVNEGDRPCLAIFAGEAMAMFPGYTQPEVSTQPDTVTAVIPTLDLDGDYQRLKANGVIFLNEPQRIEAWGMRCTYFRDPEGNLFELNDASQI